MSFQFTQQNSVLEIKQNGTKDRLQSVVTSLMDTYVYRTKTSQNFLNSVIYILSYGYKKVKKPPLFFHTNAKIIQPKTI